MADMTAVGKNIMSGQFLFLHCINGKSFGWTAAGMMIKFCCNKWSNKFFLEKWCWNVKEINGKIIGEETVKTLTETICNDIFLEKLEQICHEYEDGVKPVQQKSWWYSDEKGQRLADRINGGKTQKTFCTIWKFLHDIHRHTWEGAVYWWTVYAGWKL